MPSSQHCHISLLPAGDLVIVWGAGVLWTSQSEPASDTHDLGVAWMCCIQPILRGTVA